MSEWLIVTVEPEMENFSNFPSAEFLISLFSKYYTHILAGYGIFSTMEVFRSHLQMNFSSQLVDLAEKSLIPLQREN